MSEKDYKPWIIRQIQSLSPGVKIRIFGSRASGTHKKYSDLDLALIGPSKMEPKVLGQLHAIFAVSDIPYKIDLVDYTAVDDEFKKIIDETSLPWEI